MDSKPQHKHPQFLFLPTRQASSGTSLIRTTANLIARVNAVSVTAEELMLALRRFRNSRLRLATGRRELAVLL